MHSQKPVARSTVKTARHYSGLKTSIDDTMLPMNKMLLLNCLAVFVFFNVCVLLISCAKKKAEEIRKADASPSKPAVKAPAKSTKFTPQMVVAAFEKAGGRMPAELKAEMVKEIPLKDPAKMTEMTEELNAELASGEMQLKGNSVDALAD